MDYRLPLSKHDTTICAEIGLAAGQTPGGWPIGHRQEAETVVITLPDGVITAAQIDAIAATHPKADPKEALQQAQSQSFNDLHAQALAALQRWGSLTPADKDAILKNLVRVYLYEAGQLPPGS